MYSVFLVGIGGALGSVARYGGGLLLGRLWTTTFPLATMLINIAGSLLMGLLVGALARFAPSWQGDARLFLAVGVLGGFTTLSSFSLDTIVLIERGEVAQAALYVLASVVISIAALFVGLLIMRVGAA